MIQPYMMFDRCASEAIEFYEVVFGGTDKQVMLYGDMPPSPEFPIAEDMKALVMHAEMTMCGTRVSISDALEGVVAGDMLSLAVRLESAEEVTRIYNALLEGGKVIMELAPQFYSPLYGWVKDRFGVEWQLMAE